MNKRQKKKMFRYYTVRELLLNCKDGNDLFAISYQFIRVNNLKYFEDLTENEAQKVFDFTEQHCSTYDPFNCDFVEREDRYLRTIGSALKHLALI